MSFPHPAVTAARHAMIEALAGVPDGAAVLLAVSGGSDSMALTKVAMWAARGRIEVLSTTIDHGLRPESAAEALAVDRYLQRVVDASIVTQVQATVGDAGPEGNARAARYARIADIARAGGRMKGTGPLTVLLGHTADDQAETVLLGLGRGSGARSVAGMRAVGSLPGHDDVPMARPYLHMRRADLRTVCRELDLPWVNDPTNEIDGPWRAADGSPLRRSAIRHRVLPELDSALGGGVIEALGRTALMARDDDDALSAIAHEIGRELVRDSGDGVVIPAKELAAKPRALRTRILREALAKVARAGDVVYWHINALDRLACGVDNKRDIDVPGAFARRADDLIFIAPRAEKS